MTTTTDHSNCPHPATKAGRTACRKAGGPELFMLRKVREARESAPCQECLDTAYSAITNDIEDDDNRALLRAREYLYDRGAIAACPDHEHLCSP